jgi:hypothetical protein
MNDKPAANPAGNLDPPKDPAGTAPSPGLVLFAYALVAVAALVAVKWAEKSDVVIEAAEGFASFAVIYIVAQAVERLVQPFTYFLGKADEKKEAEKELAGAEKNKVRALLEEDSGRAANAADKKATEAKKLEGIQASRALLFWALATAISLLICGRLGLGLIQSVAEVTSGDNGGVPDWFRNWDVVITGLAIGAGTKPLHDLISFVQSKKEGAGGGAAGATA